MKYKLGEYVSFNPSVDDKVIFEGEIVGRIKAEYGDHYCIYNESYIENPGTMKMEESDIERFFDYNDRFTKNIGKRAYWRQEGRIVGISKKHDGEYCSNCKEYFHMAEKNYFEGKSHFVCYQCRQNPWR